MADAAPFREAGARRTRQAIVAAARELFAERGYAGASLATIAQAAGVARPTVAAAFGSKVELLRVVLGEALAGDDEPVPVAQRDWVQWGRDADTGPEVIAAHAMCVPIGSRAARMFEVARRAVDGNPAVAELWETMKGNRRAEASMIVDRVVSLGHLRADLDQGMAVDRLWILNDPALYEALVLQRDWEHETFRRWFAESTTSQLVAGPGVRSGMIFGE